MYKRSSVYFYTCIKFRYDFKIKSIISERKLLSIYYQNQIFILNVFKERYRNVYMQMKKDLYFQIIPRVIPDVTQWRTRPARVTQGAWTAGASSRPAPSAGSSSTSASSPCSSRTGSSVWNLIPTSSGSSLFR